MRKYISCCSESPKATSVIFSDNIVGDATIRSNVHNGDISVTGDLNITSKVVNGNVEVVGDVSFNGNVSLNGNLNVNGNLILSRDANLTVLVSRNNAQMLELEFEQKIPNS